MNGLLAKRIREKARRDGIGVEELRVRLKLGGATFYDLLAGKPPRTTRVVKMLHEGGIDVPRTILLGE